MRIKILNIQECNTKHEKVLGKGGYANIYKGFYDGKEIVLKCVPVKSEKTRRRTIEEYFLLRVASALGCAPRIDKIFGFDMLMYQECIEFPMEVCLKVDKNPINTDEIYQSLAIFHKLKIVHQDIKPDNIMFSPYKKKMVFVDFGLSRIIEEELGKQT